MELFFDLSIGLPKDGTFLKNVELLETNGIAEKVILAKIQDKPYTWQGNVLAIAMKSIGDIIIGANVRKEYLDSNSVNIPLPVRQLTLADVNTSLLEIHRRVWNDVIPNQEIICKYCAKKLVADIDLKKIDFLEETKERLEIGLDYSTIEVNLKRGFRPPVLKGISDKPEYAGFTEQVYNRFVFRPPLLADAIKHEKYFSDSIIFWRRIALDCLISIERVENGVVIEQLPAEFHTWYSLKIFNEYLTGLDLREIRTGLQEHLPTLPFAYYEPCGCDRKMDIPMIMEASNFFSE